MRQSEANVPEGSDGHRLKNKSIQTRFCLTGQATHRVGRLEERVGFKLNSGSPSDLQSEEQ